MILSLRPTLTLCLALAVAALGSAHAATPPELAAGYASQAGGPAAAAKNPGAYAPGSPGERINQ